MQPIVPRTHRPLVGAIAALAAVVTGALGIALHDTHGNRFDNWMLVHLYLHIGETGQQVLLGLSKPGIPIGLLALVVIAAALARDWRLAAVAITAPLIAIGITEQILKPLVHRTAVLTVNGVHAEVLAYPSGHETGLVAMLAVLALLLPRVQLSRASRFVAYAVLVGWVLAGAVGLVRGFYHFTTDTIGGAGVAVAVVCGLALGIDMTVERMQKPVSSPDARTPASTSPAS